MAKGALFLLVEARLIRAIRVLRFLVFDVSQIPVACEVDNFFGSIMSTAFGRDLIESSRFTKPSHTSNDKSLVTSLHVE